MFNSNSTRLMIGAKKFEEKGFDLGQVIKGKNALPEFRDLMKDEKYVKCNTFTRWFE